MTTPKYEIYSFAKGDRSARARWLLGEVGIPVGEKNLTWANGDHDKPEYLALNPMGMVPTLTENGKPIFESVAITLYLADKYSHIKPLAPSLDSPHRADYLQWALFIGATLDSKFNDLMYLKFSGDEARIQRERPAIIEDLKYMTQVLEKKITGNDYFIGGEFSAVDILVSLMADYVLDKDNLGNADYPNLWAHHERVKMRPAAQACGAFDE